MMDVKINVEKVVIFDRTKKEKETIRMDKKMIKDNVKLGIGVVSALGVSTIIGKTVNKVVMPALDGNPIAKATVAVATMGLSMVVAEKVNTKFSDTIDELFEVHVKQTYEEEI